MSLPAVSQITCKSNSGSLHFPYCDYIHFKMYCPLFPAQRFHNSDGAICDELQVVLICWIFVMCQAFYMFQFSSVQFSCSVVSDSLRPHELQHTGPPCPSPTPGVHSNSCPSSQWCHPAISSFIVPFSSYPQSLPASESFPMSQLFTWGGQSIGGPAWASFLPKNTQDWSPLEQTGCISLKSKGLSSQNWVWLLLSCC